MELLLQLFILVPLAGFVLSMFIKRRNEKVISAITITTISVHFFGIILFTVFWFLNGHPTLNIKHIVLFETDNIEIFINFYFDKITAAFALTGSAISALVVIFSKTYLHREEGFKRYFTTILLFFLSYNIVIFSGNFETFFIGWEFLGVCSFLLIAFYRDRYLPVKNSLKVISVYRLADVCLILAMWMSHHLWDENITFIKLNDLKLVEEHLIEHNWYGVFIALMIVIACAAKAAQIPFSTWLPRAMEGPTTSTGIFYGSLSVHLGVFLLMRTYPYWESLMTIKLLIIFIGASTAIITAAIARVQSTVKTQIAYSSAAQIGLMFIEVALGYHNLALIHFTGNALLRTYQLLVSPSVLSYSVHDMFFNFVKSNKKTGNISFDKISNSFYLLSLKEWNLDFLLKQLLWDPFKWLGRKLSFLPHRPALIVLSIFFLCGLYAYYFQENIPCDVYEFLPHLYSLTGLLLFMKAFALRGDAIIAWLFIVAGQLFFTISIALLNENLGHNHMALFLSGSIASSIVGYFCLRKIKKIDNNIHLNQFHGYNYEHPKTGFVFLVACLAFIGLPFTPTFIGIDLLFSHIHKHEELLIISTSLSFLLIEIAILRIYSRIFLGPHKKPYHPIAFKST